MGAALLNGSVIGNEQLDVKGAMKYSTVNVHEKEIPQFLPRARLR
jgi:hypothetical protein